MATMQYDSPAARIGKVKGDIIAHALPVEVLGITGQEKKIGKNKSDTIQFRQWLPYGATNGAVSNGIDPTTRWSVNPTSHLLQEGVTPAADTLTPRDITVTVQQYGVLYGWTDKVEDSYEDDMPQAARQMVGERVGLIREMVRYGGLKSCTNKFYSGGTTRATVDEKITANFLRKIARSLKGNHAKFVRNIIDPSTNVGTAPVEAAYLVFCHTDCEADIRDLSGFTPVAEYGHRNVVHEMELGSWESFRFIVSPELASIPDSGAAVGVTGCISTSATLIDVYPVIVCGQDAWYQTSLMGGAMENPTWLPAGKKDKNDPLGQRGYVGCSFWYTSDVIQNGWMAVGEAGASALA